MQQIFKVTNVGAIEQITSKKDGKQQIAISKLALAFSL